jgi:hydroxymethylpyrimidine/phosphomethylpyrimidine kinase
MTNRKLTTPIALSIAGSDNSGGAGIQADLKTFTKLCVYGTTAITCVVSEHPGRVKSIYPLSSKAVAEQIELIYEIFPVHAAKTGMLYSKEIILTVAKILKQKPKKKLVIDPVMVATSGTVLLKRDAIHALCDQLLPQATLVTPNLDEASLLFGKKITNFDQAGEAALACSQKWGVPFLVKGGHLKKSFSIDFFSNGEKIIPFKKTTIRNVKTHGTGCTYSAAICAELAKGTDLETAIQKAKKFITIAISKHFKVGQYQLLNHIQS